MKLKVFSAKISWEGLVLHIPHELQSEKLPSPSAGAGHHSGLTEEIAPTQRTPKTCRRKDPATDTGDIHWTPLQADLGKQFLDF